MKGLGIAKQVKFYLDLAFNLQRRQPLLVGFVFLCMGVACGYRVGALPLVLAGLLICVFFLIFFERHGCAGRMARGRPLGLIGLLFLLGWGRAAWDAEGRREEAAQLKDTVARHTFTCRVGPDVTDKVTHGNTAKFSFRAERVRLMQGGCSDAIRYLPVEVNWFADRRAEGLSAPCPGEVWLVKGRPSLRKGRDGLLALVINTGEERSKRLADALEGSWMVRIARARRVAAQRVTVGIESWGVVPQLNQAMMLGCRSEIPSELRRIFANSGTIHVFAISGLHIALVAGLLIVLVSGVGVPRPYWVFVVAPLLIFYTFTSGARPSAVRACIMAIIYFAAPLFGRKPSGVAALAATALIVYLFAPYLLYNMGCTLSFVVMGGLVVFCRPFCDFGRSLCRVTQMEERARLYEKAGSRGAANRLRWLTVGVRFAIDSIAVSLAAWLASLPLTAYYFARFTPGGFFANLVIAPCAFLVMVAGSLGLATSYVSQWVASCFNHAAGFFTVIMIRTAEITVRLRWSSFRVERWEPWMVWGWFLLLAACGAWVHVRRPDGLAWFQRGEEKDPV